MHLEDPLIPSSAAAAPELPAELEPFITLLTLPPTIHLPICLTCQHALLPHSIPEHLRKHHSLPLPLRATARTLASSLPSLDFSSVPTNPHDSAPVKELKVVEAYQCKQCGFIRRDVTDVRKHVNREHGVSAAGSYEGCRAQSWFGGRRAVYWRVRGEGKGEVVKEMEKEEEEEKEREEEEEGPVAPNNSQSLCRWGLFGKGFGDKTPRSWRETEKDNVYKVTF